MNKTRKIILLNFIITVGIVFIANFSTSIVSAAEPIIIDHTCTDLSQIPDEWIDTVKDNLHIAYQHTSHGSQLISGMNTLENFSAFGSKYEWSDSGSAGALDLDDYGIPGIPDLSQGDYIDGNGVTPWVTSTRNLLNNTANSHINVIMWSWCSINGHDAQLYVDNMEILISEYPDVTFVFMTGHAQGQGEDLTLNYVHYNNELIRQHCIANNRILFDFADIEAYNPDGLYFWDLDMIDNLNYTGGNWGVEWIENNPGTELALLTSTCGSCSHSASPFDARLNCVLKGRAVWWMFAKIAGWNVSICISSPSGLTASADSPAQQVTINWTDNSIEPDEDSFIVQRRIDGGLWSQLVEITDGSTSYVDSGLSIGTYDYRVVAHLDGDGNSCDSNPSNVASAEIISADPPIAPAALRGLIA